MIKAAVLLKQLKAELKEEDIKLTQGKLKLILEKYHSIISKSVEETGSFEIQTVGVIKKSKRNGYSTTIPGENNERKEVTIPTHFAVYFQADSKLKKLINK